MMIIMEMMNLIEISNSPMLVHAGVLTTILGLILIFIKLNIFNEKAGKKIAIVFLAVYTLFYVTLFSTKIKHYEDKPILDGENSGIYTGWTYNDEPWDFNGSITFTRLDNIMEKYEGRFKNGKGNGKGTITYRKDNSLFYKSYHGAVIEYVRQGEGELIYRDGRTEKGKWASGHLVEERH